LAVPPVAENPLGPVAGSAAKRRVAETPNKRAAVNGRSIFFIVIV
jgi:hypothetical protein